LIDQQGIFYAMRVYDVSVTKVRIYFFALFQFLTKKYLAKGASSLRTAVQAVTSKKKLLRDRVQISFVSSTFRVFKG
jgi:hypothetical protein